MMFLTRGKITGESRWCGTKDSATISEPTVLSETKCPAIFNIDPFFR
jgi:hypothetical protein